MTSKTPLTPVQRRQLYKAAYPINRSPYGGMSINQKDYRAGQFLPGRRVYDQGDLQEHKHVMPPDLDHDHLKSMDLHTTEPTWHKEEKEGRNTYGGVIFNKHGHVLMVEPTNHYYGYVWTFPKGNSDPGEHPVDAGLREVKEESGHDGQILGLLPKRFASPMGTGHAQYFIMRSQGQTSEPHWETQNTRWATPEQAHQMINMTKEAGGRDRDHEVLDMAVAHMDKLKANPATNANFQRRAERQIYEKIFKKTCNDHCKCDHCAAEQALDRVAYAKSVRYRYARIRRILYQLRKRRVMS